MARLRIPEVIRPALTRLASASRVDFESIVESLRGERPLLARRDLTRRLLDSVPTFDEDAVSDFLDVTFSLAALRVDQNMTVDEIAQAISGSGDLKIPDDSRPELKNRITALLLLPTVQQLAKAADVLSQTERTFHDARVITDVRPIFGDDPSQGPLGAIIIHNLAIEFHGPTRIDTWYVTLNERDLLKLRDVVDRAVQKGQALHGFMGTAHLAKFEPVE